LSDEKKQQVIALGRLGRSLRRIERAVHIRREAAAAYLKAAGIAVRPPGGWGRRALAKPANEVITDFGAESADPKVVPTEPQPGRSPSASSSEAYLRWWFPDNARTGVTKAHRYDPDLNPTYYNFALHCGFGIAPGNETERRDFWEICEDRYQTRSTILTSQLPVSRWHEQIGDATAADGILDRLVHNAHRIEMRGDSMRKKRGPQPSS